MCPLYSYLVLLGEENVIEVLKNGATDYVLKHRLSRLIPAVRRALLELQEKARRIQAEEALRECEASTGCCLTIHVKQ